MAVSVLTNVTLDAQTGRLQATLTAASSAGASSVFCGFTPRKIELRQHTLTLDGTCMSHWSKGMASPSYMLTGNTGTTTYGTTNGYTILDGSEAAPTAAATGSPNSSGVGFTIGTGVITALLSYTLTAER